MQNNTKPLQELKPCRGFSYPKREMIYMKEDQKARIISLRHEGRSYSQIATALSLSENTVKSICRRSAKVSKEELIAKSADCCKNCGVSLKIRNFGKPAKFCSDTCRREWWKNNNSSPNRKAYYPCTCLGCDKEFLSYGNGNRKYCSHSCYISKQFKSGGETNDSSAI